MSNISGIGRKRPQLNIPIELIELDTENPRLAKDLRGSSQIDLLQILYDEFDIEELAYSMANNGYFDEEPIVVIPTKLPENFILSSNIEQQQRDIEILIKKNEIKFIVVEGNRRTATLKLLLDKDLRKLIKVNSDFPKPNNIEVENDLKIIPAIFYPNRDNISNYLGIRHIAGLLKWEAYAKALFISNRIEEGVSIGKSMEESIRDVQLQTADRSDVIKKQYLCFKILEEAKDDINFDVSNIKNRFSLITVALNSPSIREFIGAENYKKIDFSKRVIPTKKLGNLEKLLTWIYGNKGKEAILSDSRKITSRLAPVLADEEATEYLLKYENLEDAYERSGGERKFLAKKINDATKNLRNALGFGYKYKSDTDILLMIDECVNVAAELKKMIRND